jgi:hypothetical protein
MLRLSLPILLATVSFMASAQPSDYIVLKKKNNRTLKTYFPGTFLSAVTYTGFTLNGVIKEIKNDSVFIEQFEVRQVPTQFGVPALDTVVYTIRLHYQEIRKWLYETNRSGGGTRRGGGLIQQIMIVGGIGFIVLEVVNTIYRGESFSDGNKLTAMGIAAGVVATALLWKHLQNRGERKGKKYKVIYVKMSGKKAF